MSNTTRFTLENLNQFTEEEKVKDYSRNNLHCILLFLPGINADSCRNLIFSQDELSPVCQRYKRGHHLNGRLLASFQFLLYSSNCRHIHFIAKSIGKLAFTHTLTLASSGKAVQKV